MKPLLYIGVVMLLLACSSSYEEEYVHLLEKRVAAQERRLEELTHASESKLIVSEKDIIDKTYDYIDFNCGDAGYVKDVRGFQNGPSEWDIIVNLSTLEFNDYGEPLDKSIRGKAFVISDVISIVFDNNTVICD
jgi:hypothetical protein